METLEITQNTFYSITVCPGDNRVFLKILGFWRNQDQVSNYLKDWKSALSHIKPGFTLLTDATEMKIHPSDVKELHQKAQKMVLDAGVRKVAELLNSSSTEVQLNSVARTTHFPKKNFRTRQEAIEWLNA